jgi:RIO kinase 2
MVSMDHPNAEMYFDRDVQCVKRYFQRRFGFVSDEPGPFFTDAKKLVATDGAARLDVEVEASGFSKKMAKELEAYMKEVGVDGDGRGSGDEREDDDESENEDEDGNQDEEDYDERDADAAEPEKARSQSPESKAVISREVGEAPDIGTLHISQPP